MSGVSITGNVYDAIQVRKENFIWAHTLKRVPWMKWQLMPMIKEVILL